MRLFSRPELSFGREQESKRAEEYVAAAMARQLQSYIQVTRVGVIIGDGLEEFVQFIFPSFSIQLQHITPVTMRDGLLLGFFKSCEWETDGFW